MSDESREAKAFAAWWYDYCIKASLGNTPKREELARVAWLAAYRSPRAAQGVEELIEWMDAVDFWPQECKVGCGTAEVPECLCEYRLDAIKSAMRGTSLSHGAAQQWVSVNERLPIVGAFVYLWAQGWSDVPIRARLIDADHKPPTWSNEDDISFSQEDVTHWMPLPEAPK